MLALACFIVKVAIVAIAKQSQGCQRPKATVGEVYESVLRVMLSRNPGRNTIPDPVGQARDWGDLYSRSSDVGWEFDGPVQGRLQPCPQRWPYSGLFAHPPDIETQVTRSPYQ